MNKARLLKLAKFLKTVPTRKFDMGSWGELKKVELGKPACMTQACALGWAASIPEFQKAGLKMAFDEYGEAEISYRGKTFVTAGAKFFELDDAQAEYLFGGGSNGPKGKAKEIERLVKAGDIPADERSAFEVAAEEEVMV